MIFTLLLALASAGEGIVDRIAAVVNNDVISLSEIYDIGSEYIEDGCPEPRDPPCLEDAERNVLDALIQRSLMRQELIKLGYDVTRADVDTIILQVIADYQFPDQAALREEVERTGSTWAEYRDKLREDVRTQRFNELVLRNRVTITEDEITDRFQRRIRDLETPLIAKITAFGYSLPASISAEQRIAFVTEFRALFEGVRNGARTWESVVEEYDTGNMSRAFAGTSYQRDDLAPALGEIAFNTEVGDIGEPVMIGGMLFGVRVDAREEVAVDAPSLESLREDLTQEIFLEKLADAEEAWFESAKRLAAIRVLLPDPQDASTP